AESINLIAGGSPRVTRRAQARNALRAQVSQKPRGNLLISGTLMGDDNVLVTRDQLHVHAQRGGEEHVGNLPAIEYVAPSCSSRTSFASVARPKKTSLERSISKAPLAVGAVFVRCGCRGGRAQSVGG